MTLRTRQEPYARKNLFARCRDHSLWRMVSIAIVGSPTHRLSDTTSYSGHRPAGTVTRQERYRMHGAIHSVGAGTSLYVEWIVQPTYE